MQTPLLLGIDGGGTSCRARLAAVDGTMLGEGRSGPANVRLGLEAAFGAVLGAAKEALEAAGLNQTAFDRIHAGLGLAGVNPPSSYEEARAYPLPFARTVLATDTEIARIGAHGGGDGGVVIIGTGSCAEGQIGTRTVRLGGWGFLLSDQGSGAAIGRAAIRHSLLVHDGLIAESRLAAAVLAEFDHDPDAMVRWAETARPRNYAQFGPVVLNHVEREDEAAIEIVKTAAAAIDRLILGLASAGVEAIALLGGMAERFGPWLNEESSMLLIEPQGTALDGAIFLARRSLRTGST